MEWAIGISAAGLMFGLMSIAGALNRIAQVLENSERPESYEFQE